ncbi:MAG: hypothetical protein M1838_003143 [Thelocarpon superellum]|nr:MAG: hypothetical protein M1838_003143 [Thelocarpon superellum]
MSSPQIPAPTAFVPDADTFLTLIGRNLRQHASKIPSWEALFSLSGPQLRELGVEPARDRRYLLRWRERFRQGDFGVGGDLHSVVDGVAELRAVQTPRVKTATAAGSTQTSSVTSTSSAPPGTKKVVINVAPEARDGPPAQAEAALRPVRHLSVQGARTITGPHVQAVRGTRGRVARLVAQEGLWEQRRGRKIDGGERRRAEVRAKRKGEERRDAR